MSIYPIGYPQFSVDGKRRKNQKKLLLPLSLITSFTPLYFNIPKKMKMKKIIFVTLLMVIVLASSVAAAPIRWRLQ